MPPRTCAVSAVCPLPRLHQAHAAACTCHPSTRTPLHAPPLNLFSQPFDPPQAEDGEDAPLLRGDDPPGRSAAAAAAAFGRRDSEADLTARLSHDAQPHNMLQRLSGERLWLCGGRRGKEVTVLGPWGGPVCVCVCVCARARTGKGGGGMYR
jgi:hypothetical protein